MSLLLLCGRIATCLGEGGSCPLRCCCLQCPRRYDEERHQQEQEALQACTFAPVVNRASTRLHVVGPRVAVRAAPRPGSAARVSYLAFFRTLCAPCSPLRCKCPCMLLAPPAVVHRQPIACSSDTARLQVKANRRPAAGGASDALDFRVFMQQQAALDANSKQPQAHSSSDFGEVSSEQPSAEATVPPNAEAGSNDTDNSVRPDGVESTGRVADTTAAAAEAPDAQGEVFSRLYQAGQASLRHKEAYAKASAAAERAALLSASPHPLPLPARLPAAGASRPASPAGESDHVFASTDSKEKGRITHCNSVPLSI
jgi:hypothetical protein